MSKLAELAKQLSEPANFANPANPPVLGPEISNISNISNGQGAETKAEVGARAERRDRALAELDAAPEGVRYAFVTDASDDPVKLTLAIRGVPTPTDITVCELDIPASRYDWCALLTALDGEHG